MIHFRTTNTQMSSAVQNRVERVKSINFNKWSFVKAAKDEDYLKALEDFYASQSIDDYEEMAVIGIGGSALGIRALNSLVKSPQNKKIHIFDDIDPLVFQKSLSEIKQIKKTIFVVISKSGQTEETLALTNHIAQFCLLNNVSFEKQAVVLSSSPDSELGEWANNKRVPQFLIPIDVGGRFSVLTSVGLLPALFLGQTMADMKSGVDWALNQKQLLSSMVAENLKASESQKWTQLYWVYARRWSYFASWMQQIWCESLGKRHKLNDEAAERVSSSFVCQGSNDQHSLLQQVSEAHNDKQIWFFRDEELEQKGTPLKTSQFPRQKCLEAKSLGELLAIEVEATEEALEQSGIDYQELKFEKSNMSTVSAAFMLIELYVAINGEILNINAFDQPGVEMAKKNVSKILGR